MVKKLDTQNFADEVLNTSGTVLVDFYADWCGPCKMVSPIVDEIAEERTDIVVGKAFLSVENNTHFVVEQIQSRYITTSPQMSTPLAAMHTIIKHLPGPVKIFLCVSDQGISARFEVVSFRSKLRI